MWFASAAAIPSLDLLWRSEEDRAAELVLVLFTHGGLCFTASIGVLGSKLKSGLAPSIPLDIDGKEGRTIVST